MTRLSAPERRRQILEVAAAVFAERGYRGATTAELAAAAGVSEPILYRHFASKRDLFVILVDEVGAAVLGAWREHLDAATTPAERLRVILDGNPATDDRGRGVYRVLFHAMSEPDDDAEIAAALREHIETLHAFLRDELAALQQAGVVRADAKADDLAWLLVHVATGYGLTAQLTSADPVAVRDLVEQLVSGEM